MEQNTVQILPDATAKSLRFNKDGKFSIMHITDTHLDHDNIEASVWLIAAACDREHPDLVVVTGDNVQNDDDAAVTKKYIDKLMTVFQTRNIPVAITFGNHDSEVGAMSREELMAYYNTYSCSVSVDEGPLLSGCGTYNIPILASDSNEMRFNVWVFDSNDYDGNGHYGNVKKDQVDWYKAKSESTEKANGKKVYSFAFQHMIVPEVYDALIECKRRKLYSFEHINNKGTYYHFDPNGINFGTLNETPCSGYENDGQFEAMVERGDVLAMFTGHDHTNAFGVKHKGIDIVNSLSSRYNRDAFSSQYGYRMLRVDENNPSVYTSDVVHWFDMFTLTDSKKAEKNGDHFGAKLMKDVIRRGLREKMFLSFCRTSGALLSGRKVTYKH